MLDLHAIQVTPGAATVLGAVGTTVAVNDLQNVVGVPNSQLAATLIAWGFSSIVADTIGAMKLQSQDQTDPINGEQITLGTASLQNLAYKFSKLPYKTGARNLTFGTNTGVTAGLAYTLDLIIDSKMAGAGSVLPSNGARFLPNTIVLPQTLTADTAQNWITTALAPATAIPNGKYALLGCWLTKTTGGHGIRFQHSDFGQFLPGFMLTDSVASAILGWQEGQKDILQANPGYQFVCLGELTGQPCIPVFTVGNNSTGLNIQSVAAASTDTPVINLNLAKVG